MIERAARRPSRAANRRASVANRPRLALPRIGFALPRAPERASPRRAWRPMRARRLTSSMIDRIGFDDDTGTLTVWFKGSRKYLYYAVPRALYDALGKASSAGRFFNECIKGRFECRFDPARRRQRPA